MGANFQTMKSSNTVRAEARKEFEAARDQDRYENGHSYSGGFGMTTGLEFHDAPSFMNADAAEEWLDENAQKWGEALAVQVNEGDQKFWLIGAICAS